MDKEQGERVTILLVEEDDETRRVLLQNLKRQGYHVLPALDEQDAVERIGGDGVGTDLILVNLVGVEPGEALRAGRNIRQHARIHVPLVIMAEKYGPELEGTDVNVEGDDWITYLEDHIQLQNLLARLTLKA